MKTDEMTYKVLWVDDQEEIVESTKLDADEYGIELDHYSNWGDAEVALRSNFEDYTAIILDAYCKIKPTEDIKEEFVGAVLPSLAQIFGEKNKFIPWYILSAGTMNYFSHTVKSAEYQHQSEEWGPMLYIKDAPDDDPKNSHFLYENICRVGKTQANNIILFRHRDVFNYLGKDKLIDEEARKIMLSMLGALYYPENCANYTYEGNPLRKVMEYIFRAAFKVGLLPQECIERDDQINLLESNRYMSGMNTKHSYLRYGNAGSDADGRGGDTIFPEYMGHITKAIIQFGSVDSHTNEVNPYTIDDKNLTLTDNEKELFFSYVLQLCHVIKFFGKYVNQHSDIAANKSMKKVLSMITLDKTKYEGYEGVIMQDSKGNCYCEECILSYKAASDKVGKRVRLSNIRENDQDTKIAYPLRAHFKIINEQ